MRSGKKDFFISYSFQDQAWGTWIEAVLSRHGYSTVLASKDFKPGENIQARMSEELGRTERMIAVLSHHYARSANAEAEWTAFHHRNPSGLIVVRVEDCPRDLIPILATSLQIDLFNVDKEEAAGRLIECVRSDDPPLDTGDPPFPPDTAAARMAVPQNQRNFVGRVSLLSEIREALKHHRTIALTGLGGVGKTELARKFALSERANYQNLYWIPCDTTETAIESLAAALQITKMQDQAMLEVFRSRLAKGGGWLLILDNVPDAEAIHKYLPENPLGHVLITSRAEDWSGVAKGIRVTELREDEAVDLLMQLAGEHEPQDLKRIAHHLRCLPLALHHAGHYLARTKCSCKEYLNEFFRQHGHSEPEGGMDAQDTRKLITATWSVSLRKVESESRAAGILMRLLAFYSADKVPRELFSRWATSIAELGERAEESVRVLHEAIATLGRYSLLEANPTYVSAHRLVQMAALSTIPETERRKWASRSLVLLESRARRVGLGGALLPHALSAYCQAHVHDVEENQRDAVWGLIEQYSSTAVDRLDLRRRFDDAFEATEQLYPEGRAPLIFVATRIAGLLGSIGDIEGQKHYTIRSQHLAREQDLNLDYDTPYLNNQPASTAVLASTAGTVVPKNSLTVLMVASEAVPFSKTGGLADVLGSLPQALVGIGCRAAVVLPLHRGSSMAGSRLIQDEMGVWLGPRRYHVRIWLAEQRGVEYFLVDCPELFDREGLYSVSGKDFWDNDIRFGALCMAALQLARTHIQPDVIHCHDWQTGLVPFYCKKYFAADPILKVVRTVFTVHNLGYQGLFDRDRMFWLGIPESEFHPNSIEFHGNINLLKAGLVYSDRITTVSPTYAKQIQTPEQGFGLDGLLRARSKEVIGVLNGIDHSIWSPGSDPYLEAQYGPDDMAGKSHCKSSLLNELGLPSDRPKVPLIGVVSRFASQKGFDLLAQVAYDMINWDIRLAVLGSGEQQYENMFRAMQKAMPAKIGLRIGFDNRLAHRITAGCDLFLMPSHYEPCGLNQMYAMRYGTLPLVHATGGLDDTVNPETGFKFSTYSSDSLLSCLREALTLYHLEPERWLTMMQNAMRRDYSWNASARSYAELYRDLLEQGSTGQH